MTHEKYTKGEVAIINKDRPHESKVIVVAQTNLRIFTVVKAQENPNGNWTTMTSNLTKIKKMIDIEVYINNVFNSIVKHFQDDYGAIEIGNTVNIDNQEYTVISKENDKIYLG